MQTMHAYLITGKSPTERKQKFQALATDQKIKEVHELITDSKHTIEQIRNLKHKLSFSPQDPEAGRAVYLEEAQLLTPEAANAFLKSLEEPSGHTLFILTAPNREQVLDTICSRCLEIDLGNALISKEEVPESELKTIIEQTPAKRLDYLDKISNRQEALVFCAELLTGARLLLLRQPTRSHVELAEKIEITRLDIENNVNIKLALGDLFLNLPQAD